MPLLSERDTLSFRTYLNNRLPVRSVIHWMSSIHTDELSDLDPQHVECYATAVPGEAAVD